MLQLLSDFVLCSVYSCTPNSVLKNRYLSHYLIHHGYKVTLIFPKFLVLTNSRSLIYLPSLPLSSPCTQHRFSESSRKLLGVHLNTVPGKGVVPIRVFCSTLQMSVLAKEDKKNAGQKAVLNFIFSCKKPVIKL